MQILIVMFLTFNSIEKILQITFFYSTENNLKDFKIYMKIVPFGTSTGTKIYKVRQI